jgi:peptidoglycan hydrolase-like protein with peptidoglycan-binding domain
MKKITDSFIKKIVRQSLNENYGLLNEGGKSLEKCPAGGFCIGDKSYDAAKKLQTNPPSVNYGSDLTSWTQSIVNLCANGGMGSTISESTISSIVDKIATQYSYTNTDEDAVTGQIKSLKDFPSFCAANKDAKSKGYNNFFVKKSWDGVGSGDYRIHVLNPIIGLLKNSVSISEKYQKTYEELKRKQSETWQSELKKSGWATRDEWEAAGWKPKPVVITVGGGGANNVNIAQFAPCVVEHPALETENGKPKEYSLPNGAGYKLKTGVPVIDDYIFGVVLVDDNRQEPRKMSTLKQIPIAFDCETDKFIKWSFSNNAWTYNGVYDSGGKVALTTDPSRNNDFLSESKRTKGFRYNLLTEASKVTTTTTTVATQVNPAFEELSLSKKSKGQQVVDIQTKLGISTKGGFGPQTEKAVKDFQTKYSDKAPTVLGVSDPLRTDGIVDENTYKLIMKLKNFGTPKEFGGIAQNYKVGNWLKVNPIPGNEDTKLGLNDGIFKITQILNEYTIVIDCEWDDTIKGGGTTQKLLFGDSSSEGSKTIIKKGDKAAQGDQSIEGGGNVSKGNTNTEVSAEDAEKVRKRKLRNQESCKVMREIKQYLNNTKGLDLPLNCKFTPETKNQIMMALTGGSPVTPTEQPVTSTPGGNVTVY